MKGLPFLHWMVLACWLKILVCESLSLAVYSSVLECMFVFGLPSYCCDYFRFAVSFEIRKCESYNFVLLQDWFDYSGWFEIPYKLQSGFLDLFKNVIEMWMYLIHWTH
jgi:hypothetical protein